MDALENKPNSPHRRRRRPQKRRISDRFGWIREALLGIVVVGSALAIGTVHVPVLLAVSALALIGATLEAFGLRRVPWPALVLAAFGLFSALQAIPLPAAWVNRASPASADVWSRCLVPFSEPALRRFSLSLDPGASVAEALKWLTYACVYIMATRVRARRGSARLALLLFGSAVLVTLVTLLHGIADLNLLYGVYLPNFSIGRWNVGPLLNSNNLGGYAILGLFSGGGVLLSGRPPVPRLPLTIGLGVISAALCLSGSRAAVLSVLLGGAVVLVWLLNGQGARVSLRGLALGIAPLVIGVAIAIALGTARNADQFATLDIRRKASVWLWSLPMIREHALFGVGRGAFETAFPPYRQALDYDWSIVVTHAENFVVQWLGEWGVPVGLCAVVVIVGYVLREWYRSRSDRLRFIVMTGLVTLFVQNLADLGLEVPALAIAAVLALAAGERSTTAPAGESASRLGRLAWAVSVPALALWAATVAWSRFPVELERREMSLAYRDLTIKSVQERAQFRSQLRQSVLRHPGESFFPLLGSLVAMRARDGNALTWIARSLELGPTNGPVHLALADLLQAHGATTQAMLHLRLAAQYDRTLAGAVGARAPRWAPSVDLLMQAIPEGPSGASMLLDACAKEPLLETKIDCSRRAARSSPDFSQAQQQLAAFLLFAIQARQPPCSDALAERCTEEADIAIRSAQRLEPESWRPPYLMSKVLLARGDTAGAAQLLIRVCPRSVEGDECWREALITAIKSGSNEAISTAATAFTARPCDGMEACANMFAFVASNLEAGDQAALANTFFSKAAEADPSAERWLKVAEQATQAHLYGVARAALERADRSPDASVSTRAHGELLRERVAQATVGAL
jgi:hypothetical protein